MIDYANALNDLASPPGNRLEALRGDLKSDDHVFERIVYVNGLANRRAPAAKIVKKAARTLRVGIDRRLTWGREHTVAEDDEAETTNVELPDASGSVVRSVNVAFTPLDHLPGGSRCVAGKCTVRSHFGTRALPTTIASPELQRKLRGSAGLHELTLTQRRRGATVEHRTSC
jgi:hypothetical protein